MADLQLSVGCLIEPRERERERRIETGIKSLQTFYLGERLYKGELELTTQSRLHLENRTTIAYPTILHAINYGCSLY